MKTALAFLKPVIKSSSVFGGVIIKDDSIQASNGVLTINASCPSTGLDTIVDGQRFIKAITACNNPTYKENPASITVKDGAFKSMVPLSDAANLTGIEDGDEVAVDGVLFLDALKKCQAFVSNDTTRGWLHTVRIVGGSAYASDGVVFIKAVAPDNIDCAIPFDMVAELAKRTTPPVSISTTIDWIVVKWSDTDWVKCQTNNSTWPQAAMDMASSFDKSNIKPLDTATKEAIHRIAKIAGDAQIKFTGEEVTTVDEHPSSISGVTIEKSSFNAAKLASVIDLCDGYDVSGYTVPKPCLFTGEGVTILVAGMVGA